MLFFRILTSYGQDTKYHNSDSAKNETGIDKIQTDKRLQNLTYAGDKGFFSSNEIPDYLREITVNGYCRLLTFYRDIKVPYYNGLEGRHIFVGDEGYDEPLLLVNLGGRPTKNTSFQTDLHFTDFFTGATNYGTLKSHFTVAFTGAMSTYFGNFNFRIGGLHWYELTDLTLGSISKVDRYSIFERTPWEPFGDANEKYNNFFERGSINKDARWGKREFQGIIMESANMPHGLFMKALYGKTSQNGGYTSIIPNNAIGGQLGWHISKDEFISYNTFNKIAYTDSVDGKPVGYSIHTLAYNLVAGKIIFSGEAGAGNYYSPQYPVNWSEGLKFKITLPKESFSFPAEIQFYSLGKYFVNENAGFANTTITESVLTHSTSSVQTSQVNNNPFTSPVVDMEDLTNNRIGGHIFAEKQIKKIKIRLGIGVSREIDNLYNQISYTHRINSLVMNRLVAGWNWWKGNVFGPYARTYGQFRGVYEVVNINDSTLKIKNFSNFDFQLKFNQKIFNKSLYLFYNGSLKSVQGEFSVIPKTDNTAWLRISCHEFDLYYEVFHNIMFTSYFGYETIIGNNKTDLDLKASLDSTVVLKADRDAYVETKKPRNQQGISVGAGFDIVLAKNVALYIRERWFQYKDKNFALDKFKGNETSVELKIFF